MKLPLAFLELGQLLLHSRTQLPEIFSRIVCNRGEGRQNMARCTEKQDRRRDLKTTALPLGPMGFRKPTRLHRAAQNE
jgi:hypothetical protein